MKKRLTSTLCLIACLALLCPATVSAAVTSTAETSIDWQTVTTADLIGAVPEDIISISKQNQPNNVLVTYSHHLTKV